MGLWSSRSYTSKKRNRFPPRGKPILPLAVGYHGPNVRELSDTRFTLNAESSRPGRVDSRVEKRTSFLPPVAGVGKRSYIQQGPLPSNRKAREHVPLLENPYPRATKLFEYRVSDRWAPKVPSAKKVLFRVPFIDKMGHPSMNAIAIWKGYPSSFLASLWATVYSRLNTWWSRRTSRFDAEELADLLLRAAVLSILSQRFNLTRFIEMLKRSRKAASGYVYKCTKREDEQNRFLLGQALHSASWLKHRSRNALRAKSSAVLSQYLGCSIPDAGQLQRGISNICSPWRVNGGNFHRPKYLYQPGLIEVMGDVEVFLARKG